MNKQTHEYFADQLVLAHILLDRIKADDPDNAHYFCSAAFIENMLDTYGRGMIRQSLREQGVDEQTVQAILKETNESLELLRNKLHNATQAYDFDASLKSASEQLYRNWKRRD